MNFEKLLSEGKIERVEKSDFDFKRNNFLYRSLHEIGEGEAKEIFEKAKIFVREIETFVHKNRTVTENE